MKKSFYIFICLLLSVKFWHLSFFVSFLKDDVILVLTLIWVLSSFYIFKKEKKIKGLYSFKYQKYVYIILFGIFISMFSAYFTWKQNFLTTFIAQRGTYYFILFFSILYVQPTEKDIVKALKWISIGTIFVWILLHFDQNFVYFDKVNLEQINNSNENGITKLGFYVIGIYFVILYLYFKIGEFIEKFAWNTFIEILLLLIFLVFYQNRSMLLGVIPIFLYSFLKFKSKYKIVLIIILSSIIIGVIIYTSNIWIDMIINTQKDLKNLDYNRWKALGYYIYQYSPNWFSYIFGNGFPSGGNSSLGNLMWSNFTLGIYASDLGMIGMWTSFGLIPLIAIYGLVFRILRNHKFPLYLKFISLHILFVPTIFEFWNNPGVFFFVIFIYLYAYNTNYINNRTKNINMSYSKSEDRKMKKI